MGQTYRFDPSTGQSTYQEPSPAQLRWMQQAAANDDSLPTLNNLKVMRACQERGWVRSVPERPEYMLGYYSAQWFITADGRGEVQHYAERAQLARELGVEDHPRLSKLMCVQD